MEKSALFGIGKRQISVEAMAQMIGCKTGTFPTVFLGIPIGQNMNKIKSWDPLLDKFHKKLSNWKDRTLSIGGRHTLVNNVLGSLGNFWFSCFVVPKTIIKKMEAIRRKFF